MEIGYVIQPGLIQQNAFKSCFFNFLAYLVTNADRGVQYVHWVMRKCIMAKVGGNTRKVCKKVLNFLKTGGKIFEIGEIINFRESGGNVLKQAK